AIRSLARSVPGSCRTVVVSPLYGLAGSGRTRGGLRPWIGFLHICQAAFLFVRPVERLQMRSASPYTAVGHQRQSSTPSGCPVFPQTGPKWPIGGRPLGASRRHQELERDDGDEPRRHRGDREPEG